MRTCHQHTTVPFLARSLAAVTGGRSPTYCIGALNTDAIFVGTLPSEVTLAPGATLDPIGTVIGQ